VAAETYRPAARRRDGGDHARRRWSLMLELTDQLHGGRTPLGGRTPIDIDLPVARRRHVRSLPTRRRLTLYGQATGGGGIRTRTLATGNTLISAKDLMPKEQRRSGAAPA